MSEQTPYGDEQGNMTMSDKTVTPNDDKTPEPTAKAEAKSHFTKAMDEAKAGAQALGKEAQERAGEYREKLHQTREELTGEARAKTGDAKEKAYGLANDGKAKASEAISGLSKVVHDNAEMIDEKVGPKYGNYARTAADSMQSAATALDEKSLEQLGDDAKEFVREKPMMAVGIAAAAGFVLSRLFSRR